MEHPLQQGFIKSKKIPFCDYKIPFCEYKIPFCEYKAIFAFDLLTNYLHFIAKSYQNHTSIDYVHMIIATYI